MKSSKYNYILSERNRNFIFNGLSKRFFSVSKENASRFWDIVSHPDNNYYKSHYETFLNRMKEEGFILEDDQDELAIVKRKFMEYRYSDQYMLMILPTYQCNLRCWYCIQDHQNVNLTEDVIEKIKQHVSFYLLHEHIKRFRLSWFGGEPLIAYSQVVEVTRFAYDFCQKHDIGFYSDITTNSLLLTKQRINELRDLNVKMFQISIDGCREKHNKIKFMSSYSAFDKALDNIVEIVKNIPQVTCTLRFNYSDVTLEPKKVIDDINSVIPQEYRGCINFSTCRIWQIKAFEGEENALSELRELAKMSGYKVIMGVCDLCYVDYKHFNCIFPNGTVDKCENEKLEHTKRRIGKDGNIEWNLLNDFEHLCTLSNNSDCLNCKHLPFCMGPCPNRRNEMSKIHGRVVCQYKSPETLMEKLIFRYCYNFV